MDPQLQRTSSSNKVKTAPDRAVAACLLVGSRGDAVEPVCRLDAPSSEQTAGGSVRSHACAHIPRRGLRAVAVDVAVEDDGSACAIRGRTRVLNAMKFGPVVVACILRRPRQQVEGPCQAACSSTASRSENVSRSSSSNRPSTVLCRFRSVRQDDTRPGSWSSFFCGRRTWWS